MKCRTTLWRVSIQWSCRPRKKERKRQKGNESLKSFRHCIDVIKHNERDNVRGLRWLAWWSYEACCHASLSRQPLRDKFRTSRRSAGLSASGQIFFLNIYNKSLSYTLMKKIKNIGMVLVLHSNRFGERNSVREKG